MKLEPWKTEPNHLEWHDPATGLPCLIVRGPMGALCGYVGVTSTHPLFGIDYTNAEDHWPLECHGGLTYSNHCSGHICHTPAPGEQEVWWFGFDCAHAGDLVPAMLQYEEQHGFGLCNGETYKDIAYVQRECGNLAASLAACREPL